MKLVINTGRSSAGVARELGIVDQALCRWVAEYRARQDDGGAPLSETERAELARLRKEVADLKMDRALPKRLLFSTPEEASDTNTKRSR